MFLNAQCASTFGFSMSLQGSLLGVVVIVLCAAGHCCSGCAPVVRPPINRHQNETILRSGFSDFLGHNAGDDHRGRTPRMMCQICGLCSSNTHRDTTGSAQQRASYGTATITTNPLHTWFSRTPNFDPSLSAVGLSRYRPP